MSTLSFRPKQTEMDISNGNGGAATVDVENQDFSPGTGNSAAMVCEDDTNPGGTQHAEISVHTGSDLAGGETFLRMLAADGTDNQVRVEVAPDHARASDPTISLTVCDTDTAPTAGSIVGYLIVNLGSVPGNVLPEARYKIAIYAES